MNDNTEHFDQCDQVREDLTELALGILPGWERARVLSHIETCERCAAELEQLAAVADTVLQLVPAADPPVGFELRVAQRRQAAPGPHRRSPLRRISILSAAALVAIVLGIGIGAFGFANTNNGSPSVPNLDSATLTSQGRVLGEMFVSSGRPAWLFMSIDEGAKLGEGKTPGVVWCAITLTNGKVETIGKFDLADGYGAWGAPLRVPVSEIRSAAVTGEHGEVLASAHLTA